MISIPTGKGNYEYRIVREYDPLVVAASGCDGFVYALYECHYDGLEIKEMSIVNDMTCYGRGDALDFLMRVSSATLHPIIDRDGNIVEESLIDPGRAVLSYMNRL